MGRFNRKRYTHANTATVVVPGIGNKPPVTPTATLVASTDGDDPIHDPSRQHVQYPH
jgi:hypothetical protein